MSRLSPQDQLKLGGDIQRRLGIKTVRDEDATGVLARVYADARERAGGVANVLRIQSVNPPALRAGVALYRETALAASPLSRAMREMIATVVSRVNECHY